MSDRPSDYAVGYGRPPKATQFQPGQSGNRKGRPKGSRNIALMLDEELGAGVMVTIDGRRVRRSKGQIMVRQVVDRAAKGDLNAAKLVLRHQGQAAPLPTLDMPSGLPEIETELTAEQCADILRSIARDYGTEGGQ